MSASTRSPIACRESFWRCLRGRVIAETERQRHVLRRRQRREQVEELEDHPDMVASERGSFLVAEGVHVDALDLDLPLIGRLEAAEDVQQGALAAAARAHDRDELARVHGERDTSDGLAGWPADPVDLVESRGDDDAVRGVARGRFDGAELSQGHGPRLLESGLKRQECFEHGLDAVREEPFVLGDRWSGEILGKAAGRDGKRRRCRHR